METKPSYLTSEFWLVILGNAFGIVDILGWWKFVPNTWAVGFMAVITALYTLSRGVAKNGVEFTPPVNPPTTPTTKK